MSTSTRMPSNGSNVSDRTSSFSLGRQGYNFSSHNPTNVNKNIDYSSVLGKPSSIIYGKPLNNTSSDLRVQRLRLNTIGAGSMRVKNSNDYIQLNGKNQDVNLINNVLSRVRGSGSIVSKKGKNHCTFCV